MSSKAWGIWLSKHERLIEYHVHIGYKNMYECIINIYVPHEVKYQRA